MEKIRSFSKKECATCGAFFQMEWSGSKFCSARCQYSQKFRVSDNGCHIWTAAVDHAGYGIMSRIIDGRRRSLHATRVVWEDAHGVIPDGMLLLHSCDTPRCINLNHLRLGTNADNKNDCVQRDRHAVGKMLPHSKLESSDVIEIRRMIELGYGLTAIGVIFGVTAPSIRQIKNGVSYKWLK